MLDHAFSTARLSLYILLHHTVCDVTVGNHNLFEQTIRYDAGSLIC
jgi:hypothetical protein